MIIKKLFEAMLSENEHTINITVTFGTCELCSREEQKLFIFKNYEKDKETFEVCVDCRAYAGILFDDERIFLSIGKLVQRKV